MSELPTKAECSNTNAHCDVFLMMRQVNGYFERAFQRGEPTIAAGKPAGRVEGSIPSAPNNLSGTVTAHIREKAVNSRSGGSSDPSAQFPSLLQSAENERRKDWPSVAEQQAFWRQREARDAVTRSMGLEPGNGGETDYLFDNEEEEL